MLKVLVAVGLGFLLFSSSSPDAPQITAEVLRTGGEGIAPAVKDEDHKTHQNQINEVLKGNQWS